MAQRFQDSFSRLDTIPACDRQTDGQTPHDNRDRAMQSVARVKQTAVHLYILL